MNRPKDKSIKWKLSKRLLDDLKIYIYAGDLQTVPAVLKRWGHASWSWETYDARDSHSVGHVGSCYSMKALIKAKGIYGTIHYDQGRYIDIDICTEKTLSLAGQIVEYREWEKLINKDPIEESIRKQIEESSVANFKDLE